MNTIGRTSVALAAAALLAAVIAGTVVAPRVAPDPPPVEAAPDAEAVPEAPCLPAGAIPGPDGPLTEAERERIATERWDAILGHVDAAPLPRTDARLDARLDAAFAPVEARIPAFLDWHYSLAGQYTQLAQTLVGWLTESEFVRTTFEQLWNSELAQTLIERLAASETARTALTELRGSEPVQSALEALRLGVDERLFGDLPAQVEEAARDVESVLRAEVQTLVEQRLRAEAETLAAAASVPGGTPCAGVEAVDPQVAYEGMLRAAMPLTVRRFVNTAAPTGAVAVGAGLGGGLAARALVQQLSRRLLSRTAGRAARTFAFGAGGVATTAGAWLLVDAAVLFLDEHFGREALEAELAALVDEQKEEVRTALTAAVAQARSEALGSVTPAELGRRG